MKFSAANTKLKKLYKLATTVLKRWLGQKVGRSTPKVYSFDILSGVDCPFLQLQISGRRAGRQSKNQGRARYKFRCFLLVKVLFILHYLGHKRNHDAIHALETSDDMADALCAALPMPSFVFIVW